MSRTTKEWFARHKDGTYNHKAEVPPSIKLRVRARANHCCQNCGVRVRYGGQVDHIEALVFSTDNRPLNRESNLRFLCANCHKSKTARDVKQKASEAKTQIHLAGFKPKSKLSRGPRQSKLSTRGQWKPWTDENGRERLTWVPPGNDSDN